MGLLAWYFFSPASTAIDRVGLYLLPMQLFVFSQLPEVFESSHKNNMIWVGFVIFYYATVEFVWLNFATHAFAWIPYNFYPFVGLF